MQYDVKLFKGPNSEVFRREIKVLSSQEKKRVGEGIITFKL